MEFPFTQEKSNGKIIRTFSKDVDDMELKWHYDEKDRTVKIISGEGWLLQMDNQLPTPLTCEKEFHIPKGVYHRVKRGTTDLVVEITEHDNI